MTSRDVILSRSHEVRCDLLQQPATSLLIRVFLAVIETYGHAGHYSQTVQGTSIDAHHTPLIHS